MDDHLKLLADVGLALDAAEEALAVGEARTAVASLDEADEALVRLRAGWPRMSAPERRLVGATAAPLRARLDAVRKRVPVRSALSTGTSEVDVEQELDPAVDAAV